MYGRQNLLQRLIVLLGLCEVEVLRDISQANLVYGLIYQVLLSLGLLAQLFAEPEKLFDGGVIILFHDILGNKMMNVSNQKFARIREVSQALHELLGARDLLQVHDDQFEFNDRFAIFNELGHDVDYLSHEVLDLLLLPLLGEDRDQA